MFMNVSERIMTLLQNSSKSQKDLADYIGTKEQTISDWKSGKTKSYTNYIEKIADFFNCTTDYIYGRTNVPNIYKQNSNSGNNLHAEGDINIGSNSNTDKTMLGFLKILEELSPENQVEVMHYALTLKKNQ